MTSSEMCSEEKDHEVGIMQARGFFARKEEQS